MIIRDAESGTRCEQCGGDLPADAVAKQWMQAYAANDGTTLINLTCAADQAQLQQGRALQAAVSGLASGLFGGGATQVTVANLAYETTDKSGSQATVHVSGPMGGTLLGLSQTQNVDCTLPLAQENGKWSVCPR